MKDESMMYLERGIKIAEECLNNCNRLRIELSVFEPNRKIVDILLAKGYLKLNLNGDEPDSDVLIFHNSEDKYAHNGDISITCFFRKALKVFAYVRKHKKVLALIKELKRKGGNK